MSVTTTADERLDSAIEHMKDAVKNLNDIVIGECWGYDEFKTSFRQEMTEVMMELIRLRKRLRDD
jgi:hypothetical protein